MRASPSRTQANEWPARAPKVLYALLTEANFELPAAIAGNCAANQKLLDCVGASV